MSEYCPNCKRRSDTAEITTVTLSLSDWPSMLISFCVMLVFSQIVGVSTDVTLTVALVSCIPFCFASDTKSICHSCEFKFEPDPQSNLS